MESILSLFLQFLVLGPLGASLILWLYSRKYAHLPGDFGFPIIGSLYKVLYTSLNGSPTALFERLEQLMDKYGRIACTWVGPFIMVIVADPCMVEEMSTHPAAINKEPWVFDKLTILAKGAFTRSQSDAEWRQLRKKVNESLRKNRLLDYHDVFVRRSLDLVKALGEKDGEFDVHDVVALYTLDVALEAHFGYQANLLPNKEYCYVEDLKNLTKIMAQSLANPLYVLTSWITLRYANYKMKHLKRLTNKIYNDLIKNYDEIYKYQDNSTLPYGIANFKHNIETNVPHETTLLEVKETIFVTSHTTGDLTSALLVILAVNPELQEKAWEEQNEIFGGSSRTPTYEDIGRMEYLERIVREGSRFFAAPILARRMTEDAKIGGYRIPKNSCVIIDSMRMRMDPHYWENPTKFDPDHFSKEKSLNQHKFANLAFGFLPRHCPGILFTLNSAKASLSAIIRNFKLSSPLRPEDLKFHPEIMMELNGPYLISCERRE